MKLNCLLLFFCSFLFGFFPDFYLIGQSKEDPDPLRFEESFQNSHLKTEASNPLATILLFSPAVQVFENGPL